MRRAMPVGITAPLEILVLDPATDPGPASSNYARAAARYIAPEAAILSSSPNPANAVSGTVDRQIQIQMGRINKVAAA